MEEKGDIIEVKGRPEWLSDSDLCEPRWNDEGWYGDLTAASNVSGWERVTALRLAANNPRYATPTETTFRQGDYVVALEKEIDGDISRGTVYRLTAVTGDAIEFVDDGGDDRIRTASDYRPATPAEIEQYEAERRLVAQMEADDAPKLDKEWFATATRSDGDKTVALPMMMEDEAKALASEKCGWLEPDYHRGYMKALRELGLIVADPIAQIAKEFIERKNINHAWSQKDVIYAAIKWARENG